MNIPLYIDEPKTGILYTIVNNQNYYIGNGIYRRASNRGAYNYANMFLPFYDRNTGGFLAKAPFRCDGECNISLDSTNLKYNLMKYNDSNLLRPYYTIFSNEYQTIFTYILNLLKEDSILEYNQLKKLLKNDDSEFTDEDWEELNEEFEYLEYTGSGYRLKLDIDSELNIFLERLDEIMSGSKEKIIIFLKDMLSKMITVSESLDIEIDDDGEISYEESFICGHSKMTCNIFNISYGELIQKIHSELYKNSNIIILLSRFLIYNDFEQLKTSLNLTKSFMLQFPDNIASYNDKLIWFKNVTENGIRIYKFNEINCIEDEHCVDGENGSCIEGECYY